MDPTRTVRLHTGRTMPVLGLGTWELTHDTADTILEALRLGYRMIDTACDYGSQPGIGQALRRTDVPRGEVFLVAKVEEDEDAYESLQRYLDQMQQARAELVLIHRPPQGSAGVELWQGLIRAREEGLAGDIGVSNYAALEIEELVAETGVRPVVNQVEWSPFGWKPEVLAYHREHHMVLQAYSPLTRGHRLDDERLGRIAAAVGRTPAQVLLRWNLQLGTVPLPKANQRAHLVENLGAFDFALSPDQMQELGALDEQYSALGSAPRY